MKLKATEAFKVDRINAGQESVNADSPALINPLDYSPL